MAFSDLARRQMRDPLGSLADVAEELQALKDILLVAQPAIANGITAVLDVGAGIGILEDAVGTAAEAATAPDAAEPRSDSEMSEPTQEEKLTRQQQLAAASKEFDEAVATGVFIDENELYSDGTVRPIVPPVVAPKAPEQFNLATGDSTPPPR